MSLVPFNNNGNGQWDVVLQDSSRQAVVLYDRNSHRMTLVNNARVLSTLERVDNSSNSQERCLSCGQIIPVGRRRATVGDIRNESNNHVHYNSHEHAIHHEFNTSIPSSPTSSHAPVPIVSRDANYFQLLEYGNLVDPTTSRSSSPVVFTPVDTPQSTPRRVVSPSVTPIPSENRSSGISDSAFSQGYFDK